MGRALTLAEQDVMLAPLYADPINYEETPRTMKIGATTNEQLLSDDKDVFHALEREGYLLIGQGIRRDIDDLGSTLFVKDCVDFEFVLAQTRPQVIVLDQRSHWLNSDPAKRFRNLDKLAAHSDIFRVAILRSLTEQPGELHDFYTEYQPHAYITTLDPVIVCARYPFMRVNHTLVTPRPISILPNVIEGLRRSYNR